MFFRHPPLSLRFHMVGMSVLWVMLVGGLGFQADRVARRELEATRVALTHDVSAEAHLQRLESQLVLREQAEKKFSLTGDELYQRLAQHYGERQYEAGSEFEHEIENAYGNQATFHAPKTRAEVSNTRAMIEELRRLRLEQTENTVSRLAQTITLGFIVSLAIGLLAWWGLRRGVIEPLANLEKRAKSIEKGQFPSAPTMVRTAIFQEVLQLTARMDSMANRLAELDQAKTEFLASVSHELKNPLAALKEGLELLAEQGDRLTPGARSRTFGACVIATKRLETMINNILRLSRGEWAHPDVQKRKVGAAIQIAIDEIRPLADRKGVRLAVQGDPNLEGNFDWNGIVQVFENLLVNAIKYGDAGAPIELSWGSVLRPGKSSGVQPYIEFSVVNSGRAIAASEVGRIFDPFYRAENAKGQQGLGIGLHVVKKIIESHGGGVTASADPQGRTCFRLWIPAALGGETCN